MTQSDQESAQSNKDATNDIAAYDELIAIFDSVNLRAKPREEILAWHHKQAAQETNKARIDELMNIEVNFYDVTNIAKRLEKLRNITADKEPKA